MFENINLVRTVNLDKGYPREIINVVVRNVGKEKESKYYIPFEAELISRIGGFEVRDKKDVSKPAFKIEATGYDGDRLGSQSQRWQIHKY